MILSFKLSYILFLIAISVYLVISQPIQEDTKKIDESESGSIVVSQNILLQDKNAVLPEYQNNNKNKNEESDNSEVNNNKLLIKSPRGLQTEESSSSLQITSDEIKPSVSSDPLVTIYSECKDSVTCTEEKLVSLIDRVDSQRSIPLFSGLVTVEKNSEEKEENKEPETPKFEEGLVTRLDRYLANHCLRVHIPGLEDTSEEQLGARSLDFRLDTLTSSGDASEGRGRLKKLILPFLLLLKLKFAILLPIFISVIALIAVKGLWAGLAAMLVSGFVGLKSFLSNENNNSPSTRVTLVKPHVIPDIYHSDLLHGWSRSSLLDPYRGYIPATWDRPNAR